MQFYRLSLLPGEEMLVNFGEGVPTRVSCTECDRESRLFVATLRFFSPQHLPRGQEL